MATDLNRISGLHGLSIADFHLLSALMMSAPSPMRATDLAHALNVSNAALSGRIARLARNGLLTSPTDPSDQRAKQLLPTQLGKEKVLAIGVDLEEIGQFVRRYRQLPEADRVELDRIMGNLHMLLDRDFEPSPRGTG